MVLTVYSTDIRCSELCRLKVSEIDSERMVIHIHKGGGGRDRDVLLRPKWFETLRLLNKRVRFGDGVMDREISLKG